VKTREQIWNAYIACGDALAGKLKHGTAKPPSDESLIGMIGALGWMLGDPRFEQTFDEILDAYRRAQVREDQES
jgi:hypothetical protein